MSISVAATARLTTQAPDNLKLAGASSANADSAGSTAVRSNAGDEETFSSMLKPPTKLHFPWLSRLTAELEPAATQKSPFSSAPQLGDNLDQAV